MKHLSTLILTLLSTLGYSQDFYDMNTIQTIEITFEENNWDQLLDAQKAGDEDYILAQSVSINGTVFDSVGVKYKGNSTYSANQTKNPFHIELDTYKDHEYQGYKDIKLSNVAKDPSFLREVLSYQVLRQYMDAPLCNYANVYVNGNLMGLYSNAEAITKTFVKDRFYSKKNTFVKCNPPDGAGPQSRDFPNLEYLGQDSTDYYAAYELKSDDGWDELIDLCDTLKNDINAIEQILDVDRALWMLAFNNVTVNLDSYIGAFAQNYYLYRMDNGRYVSVVWDLNESFGRFSMTGNGNLNNTSSKQQMSALLHENDTSYPLISKLLSVPTYKRMYLAHCKTILLENFDNDAYLTTGQNLQTLIAAAVQADDNKFFTYANFLSNLDTDINSGGGPGGGSTPGIAALMSGRSAYLLGQSEFTQIAPTITEISPTTTTPLLGETIAVTATVSAASTVYLGHRSNIEAVFQRVLMYDDGTHNDGAANDGVYGADLLVDNSYVQYYIYAENDNAGIFSPLRAEHEYHTINTITITVPVGDLVINELMASNELTIADQDGEYDDWIELYNNSAASIDLSGYFLSDDGDELSQWTFPVGSSIAANDYLIIWADKDDEQTGLHANFKLSASGETLYLSAADETVLDSISYLDQSSDVALGRFPNGTGAFRKMVSTFNAENSGISAVANLEPLETEFSIYPNPATTAFFVDLHAPGGKTVQVYNLNGQEIFGSLLTESKWINCDEWTSGVYLVKVDNAYQRIVVD